MAKQGGPPPMSPSVVVLVAVCRLVVAVVVEVALVLSCLLPLTLRKVVHRPLNDTLGAFASLHVLMIQFIVSLVQVLLLVIQWVSRAVSRGLRPLIVSITAGGVPCPARSLTDGPARLQCHRINDTLETGVWQNRGAPSKASPGG